MHVVKYRHSLLWAVR